MKNIFEKFRLVAGTLATVTLVAFSLQYSFSGYAYKNAENLHEEVWAQGTSCAFLLQVLTSAKNSATIICGGLPSTSNCWQYWPYPCYSACENINYAQYDYDNCIANGGNNHGGDDPGGNTGTNSSGGGGGTSTSGDTPVYKLITIPCEIAPNVIGVMNMCQTGLNPYLTTCWSDIDCH